MEKEIFVSPELLSKPKFRILFQKFSTSDAMIDPPNLRIAIRNSPFREPIKVFPLLIIALHSEWDILEVNEGCRDHGVCDSKDDPSCSGTEIAREMVKEEALGENGKV